MVPILQLTRDDLLGITALTRQTAGATVVALSYVSVLYIPVEIVDAIPRSEATKINRRALVEARGG